MLLEQPQNLRAAYHPELGFMVCGADLLVWLLALADNLPKPDISAREALQLTAMALANAIDNPKLVTPKEKS